MRSLLQPHIGIGHERALVVLPMRRKGHREEADDYPALVAELNNDWRIIECRDGIQWILQRLAGMRHGQPRWEGKGYCRTRQALLRSVHERCGPVGASALATLESLPDWIGGRPGVSGAANHAGGRHD